MCSIGEDDFGDDGGTHAMIADHQVPEANAIPQSCMKCGIEGTLIKLKFREAECKDCFLSYARHKFRATLGSSKVLPKGAEVLLLFDGSAESLVLLDMMQYAQTQNTHKRLHVSTKVLFIDESPIDNAIKIDDIKVILSNYNFEAFVISLADKDSLCKLEELKLLTESKSNFASSVKNIKTLTSRQDFLKVWKTSLIEAAAHKLSCGFVFLPEISTHLATEFLNSISLGRGGSAALDVSLMDDRLAGLKVIRPLRTLNQCEVRFYLQVNGLRELKTETYGEVAGSNASIQNLTKRFVDDLQANFSSTISTVFRTGDKIAANVSNDFGSIDQNLKCSFCNSNMDRADSRTLLAIEFSRIASSLRGNLKNCEEQVTANEKLMTKRLPGKLCHACDNIQKDCGSIDLVR